MSAPASGLEQTDRPTIDRARHYEHAAIASILDRCLDPLYGMSFALTGTAGEAETVTLHALTKGLDALNGFRGDESHFEALLMRSAARAAALRQPSEPGLRQSLTQLTATEYELVALRVFAGLSTELLSQGPQTRHTVLRAQLLNALRLVAGDRGAAAPARKGQDLAQFDAAVDRVVAGETPEHAAVPVSEPTDVLARLRTVTSLRKVPCTPITSAARERIHQEVLALAQERRVRWVQEHLGSPRVPGMEKRRYPRPTRSILTLGVGLVLAALVGTTLAVVTSFADPDSLLYPLKRLGESVLVAATPDRVNRAELEVKLSQTRAREAEDMASRGKGELAVRAVQDRVSLLQAAGRDLSSASPRNNRWKSARNQFLSASEASMDDIEHYLDTTGQSTAAQEVRHIDTGWIRQQVPLRESLGQPVPSPSPPPPASG